MSFFRMNPARSVFLWLLVAACAPQPTDDTFAVELNLESSGTAEPAAVSEEIAAKAAYHVEGLYDHLDQNRVWFYSAKGNDFAEISDPSQVAGFKDGDPIAFACEDAGLVEVGTNSYTDVPRNTAAAPWFPQKTWALPPQAI